MKLSGTVRKQMQVIQEYQVLIFCWGKRDQRLIREKNMPAHYNDDLKNVSWKTENFSSDSFLN